MVKILKGIRIGIQNNDGQTFPVSYLEIRKGGSGGNPGYFQVYIFKTVQILAYFHVKN